jgi:hypothetical protein
MVSYNGYAREFPAGGNYVLALDLCRGEVAWKSASGTANGGLLLLGDHLVTAYGFTAEPRFVFVFNARSGALLQKLPVVESVCPRPDVADGCDKNCCDRPGQRVGRAASPHISEGRLVVETNMGYAAFSLE